MIKKNNYNKKILIFLILLFFLFSFIFQEKIRDFSYYIFSPFQKYFYSVGADIYSVFEKKEEIAKLRKENALLIYELNLNNIYKEENVELKKALDIEINKEFDLIFSEIVSKKLDSDVLVINKGKNDGIIEGMPVITSEKILAGKILKVYDNFSEVALITKKDFIFDIIIANEIFAVSKGLGNLSLNFDMVPPDKEPKEEDIVITSRMGGVFPEGLLVGKIESVNKNDTDFYFYGKIKSSFELNIAKNLFIINKPIL